MDEQLEYDIIQMLKTRFELNVNSTSEYNGGMNGGSMYTDCKTIQLLLDGEVISEVSL